ncbi:SUMF1/EgtB/PvdO family nonheme iron enzyme [Methanolobus sp. WCC4]|uniref:SUMF1/EgtB/PvdO family nonheme iron enzyme n=1 Tax=Methanolobus sp. WCC4 TaxID=3125784 RepID=UPI0030F7312A
MADIGVKRGYEVLPDNSVRFGIRVINNSPAAILDVEIILGYPESLFKLHDGRIQKLGNIPPAKERTAKFVLKPLGCVHQEYIGATVQYNDHTYEKNLLNMRRKEIHCVCPFLRAKSMSKVQFLQLSSAGHSTEAGLNFEGVSSEQVLSFLMQICTNRLYKVEERFVDGGKILYLSSESIGEDAYYLLTVLIKGNQGQTLVMLRAVSNKAHGLQGFLNETVSELRHLVNTVKSSREIGVIKHEKVINIIDSVVQRSNFSVDGSSGSAHVQESTVQRSEITSSSAKVNIQDSVVQRTTIIMDSGKKEEEDERKALGTIRLRSAEEAESKRMDEVWSRIEREEQERLHKEQEEQQRRKEQELKARIAENKSKEKVLSREREEQGRMKKADFINSIGIQFIAIPAGEFMMGSNEYDEEKPVHKVTIPKPFLLGKYPVTQKEWFAVMGSNPSQFKGDNRPVENISWNDAQEFVKRLNTKEVTNKYRLPSEAEWEYACRAGTNTNYSFGDSESHIGDYAWYEDNSGHKTHPVGQKKPNPCNLYDLHGNVWEWVQDNWLGSYEDSLKHEKKNKLISRFFGKNREKDDLSLPRVRRGGGWINHARNCRSATRYNSDSNNRYGSIGFRLLREM